MRSNPPKRAHGNLQVAVMIFAVAMLALAGANSVKAAPGSQGEDEILVFAASSLAPPLQQIATLYEAQSSVKLRFAFASSAALARQIEYGAPADLFITAHPLWLERLAAQHQIDSSSARAIAGNRLVLARPAGSASSAANVRALLLAPDAGRIATGDPASVPLGMYARSSLEALGLWQAVGPRLAPAANARAALLQVERGMVGLGILFASDAAGSDRVTIVAEIPPGPAGSGGQIQYLAALVGQPPGSKTAAQFLLFLTSPEAQEVFLKQGFSAPE